MPTKRSSGQIAGQPAPRRRVVVVASWYPGVGRPIDGIFVRDQAAVLARSMDVAVIAPVLLSWRTLLNRTSRPSSGGTGALDDPVPTLRPRAPLIPKAPRFNDWSYRVAVARSLRRLESHWGLPDVINAHVVLPAGQAAVRIGAQRGTPVVLTEHSAPLAMHLRTDRQRAAVVHTLRSATIVTAVGPALREEIRELVDRPVEVVGNVVAPEFFAEPLLATRSGPGVRLLAVGVLRPAKGFDDLLRAMREAADVQPEAQLVIVGEGPERQALVELAGRLGLTERVRFEGLATRGELRHWVAWADVLVSASHKESFGLAVAEALASGLPAITTASGGPESFVDPDIGIVVPVGDVEALAHALRQLPLFLRSFDPTVSRLRMAGKFGPEVFSARMAAIFEAAVAIQRHDGRASTE